MDLCLRELVKDGFNNYGELLIHLKNNEIDVNAEFRDGIRLFDYLLVKNPLNNEKQYHKVIEFFFNKKELIITGYNMIVLNGFFIIHRNPSGRRADMFEFIKPILNNKSASRFEEYQTLLNYYMDDAIDYGCVDTVTYILNLPNYTTQVYCDDDMRVHYSENKPLIHKCMNKFNDQRTCDIEKWLIIMKKIMQHHTFYLSHDFNLRHLCKLTSNPRYATHVQHYQEIKKIYYEHKMSASVSKLFLLMVGHSDGYFKTDHGFFNITKNLPMEIQMIIANRAFGKTIDIIPSNKINQHISIIN